MNVLKPEFTVIGDWAISNVSGRIRHKVCKRWCIRYLKSGDPFHECGGYAYEDDDRFVYGAITLEIPEFVRLIAQAFLKGKT